MNPGSRIAAAIVAISAWAGIAIHFAAVYGQNHSIGETLWALLWYFTITTNLLVAVVFTGVALGVRRCTSPHLLGGITYSIVVVGVVYTLLLHGLVELSGGSAVANALVHWVTPVLVAVYSVVFVTRRTLRTYDPLIWAPYPLAYLAYALLRGESSGRYPYPFMNVAVLGWTVTLRNCSFIAVGFFCAGYLLVMLDRYLPAREPRG